MAPDLATGSSFRLRLKAWGHAAPTDADCAPCLDHDHAGEPLPSRRGTQPVPYVAPEVAAYWLASLNRGAAIDGALSVGLVAHESLDA